MYENLLAAIEQVAEPSLQLGLKLGPALPEALRISGIALVAIFFVMGLFGAMITLLSSLFPESGKEPK